jgi:hypothetical protein
MNQSDANKAQPAGTPPLFASSWRALFALLYAYLYQRSARVSEKNEDNPGTD